MSTPHSSLTLIRSEVPSGHSGSQRLARVALACLFSAVLLFAQAVDLSHNHQGDLQAQFDCDICLATSTLSGAIAASELGLDSPRDTVAISDWSAFHVSHSAVTPQARAPPIS